MDLILAAYLDGPRKITTRTIPVPECPFGYSLIRVAYAGICGSDLLQYRGIRSQSVQPIGHEFSGRIIMVNDVSSTLMLGETVCVSAVASCGDCPACISKQGNLCLNRIFLPAMGPGGFSEIAVVPLNCIYTLPQNLQLQDAAIAEPFAVALHALRKVTPRNRNTILIVGAGTIGLAVSQLAKTEGFKEINILCRYPFQAKMAKYFGVTPVYKSHHITPNYFDMVINTVPGSAAMAVSIDAVVNGGTVILCGGFSLPEEYSLRSVVSREINLQGSICYTKSEFLEILRLMNTKIISPRLLVTHKFDLSDISNAFLIADNKKYNQSIKVLVTINQNKK